MARVRDGDTGTRYAARPAHRPLHHRFPLLVARMLLRLLLLLPPRMQPRPLPLSLRLLLTLRCWLGRSRRPPRVQLRRLRRCPRRTFRLRRRASVSPSPPCHRRPPPPWPRLCPTLCRPSPPSSRTSPRWTPPRTRPCRSPYPPCPTCHPLRMPPRSRSRSVSSLLLLRFLLPPPLPAPRPPVSPLTAADRPPRSISQWWRMVTPLHHHRPDPTVSHPRLAGKGPSRGPWRPRPRRRAPMRR